MSDSVEKRSPCAESAAVVSDAVLSPDEVYRYQLMRRWKPGMVITWVMLNPSTADASVDDPTIRRCVGFTKRWGWNGIRVVNLYGLRATNPTALTSHDDPFGPDNERWLLDAILARDTAYVIAAWGASVPDPACPSIQLVRSCAPEVRGGVWTLGTTKAGHPRHPLYVRGDALLAQFAGSRP